jgi:SAM-dependent MidA family methyltransferase
VSLLERLVDRIRSEGPIPFEEFQSIALYDPEDGFFGSGKLRSAKEGDFLTSPEVSPLFGETLAVFVDQVLETRFSPQRDAGQPSVPPGARRATLGGKYRIGEAAGVGGLSSSISPVGDETVSPPGEVAGPSVGGSTPKGGGGPSSPLVVEVGAGSGSLLRPLLASLEHPLDAWAVEASSAARVALAKILPEDHILSSLEDLPERFCGVVIANELLDNLPVALAVRVGVGWEERWVGVEDDRLVLVHHEARPEVSAWADHFGLPCPDGGRVEVQLAARAWLRDVLRKLGAGSVLVIDYGETSEGLEHRRNDGTVRTYRAHHLGPQPLSEPGETDITVDVNFTALMAIAEEEGGVVELHRQDDFLEELGLRDRITQLRERELAAARSGDTMGQLQARSDHTNAETLLHPRGLGDFRVLVVRK